MDIALVRGPYLRPNGVLPWTALDSKYDDLTITAFESDPTRFDTSKLSVPVKQLPWPDGKLDAFGHDHIIDRGLNHLGFPSTFLTGIRRVARNYDVIHTSENSNLFSLQAALAARAYDTTFVFSAGENIPFYPDSCLTRQVKRVVNHEAAAMTTTTAFGKRALIHEGVDPEQIAVIPNTIDFDAFDNGPKDASSIPLPNEFDETFNILFVHSLCEQKGVDYLIRAFEDLHTQYSDTRLILVGENKFSEQFYQSRVAAASAIHHIEYIENDRIDSLYNLSDVFVLPSVTMQHNQEQFGMAVLEAMACGVPSIVTNVGGLPHVVSAEETSIVVEERSSSEIQAALDRLYSNADLRSRLGADAHSYVRETYDPENLADRLYAFYQDL